MGCGASNAKNDAEMENVMTAQREATLVEKGETDSPVARVTISPAQWSGAPQNGPRTDKKGTLVFDAGVSPGCLAPVDKDGPVEEEEAAGAEPTPSGGTSSVQLSSSTRFAQTSCTLPPEVLNNATFTLLHFNDVYNIEPLMMKEPIGGAARFTHIVKQYKEVFQSDVMFSGDCYNPSIMSTVTRGKHMTPILNELEMRCAVYGNHDFDFGVDVLKELTAASNAPWLMSNVLDEVENCPAADGLTSYSYVRPAHNFRTPTIKIGVVGCGEKAWLSCIKELPDTVRYHDAVAVANREADKLKDDGCDIVIALTHMRHNNDVSFTKACPGIDIVLGGHDHFYQYEVLDTGQLLVKSGTDFKNLSFVTVQMPRGAGRPRFHVERIDIVSSIPEDPTVKELVTSYKDKLAAKIEKEICNLGCEMDVQTSTCRTEECSVGNLITDIMRDYCHSDCAFVNAGVLRADIIYDPRTLTLKDLLDITPFPDAVVCIELTGQQLIGVLENGVSKWPQQEGRFLQVSGIAFVADTTAEPKRRVRNVMVNGQPIDHEKVYTAATTAFLCKGCDGFEVLNDGGSVKPKYLVDPENAETLPTIFRKAIEAMVPAPARQGRRESVAQLRKTLSKQSLGYREASDQIKRAFLPTITPRLEGRIKLLRDGEDELNETMPQGLETEVSGPTGVVLRDIAKVKGEFKAHLLRMPTSNVAWNLELVPLLGKKAMIKQVTSSDVGLTELAYPHGKSYWFPSSVVEMVEGEVVPGGRAATPMDESCTSPHHVPARSNSTIGPSKTGMVRKKSLIPKERTMSFILRPVGPHDLVSNDEVRQRGVSRVRKASTPNNRVEKMERMVEYLDDLERLQVDDDH